MIILLHAPKAALVWMQFNRTQIIGLSVHRLIAFILYSLPLWGPRAFDIMRLGWYRQTSPKLHRGFSAHIPSLSFSPLCLCNTALRPREGLFRQYLSRLVFPSTKLRMNESNPSVFDPRPHNVLLFSLWRWRRWKAAPFSLLLKQSCDWNFSVWSHTTLWLTAETNLAY